MTANTVFFVVVVPCLGYLTRKIYYQTDELYRNTVFFVVVVPCLGYLTRKIYYQTDELYRNPAFAATVLENVQALKV